MNSILKKNLFRTIVLFVCIILIAFSLFLSILIYHIKTKDVTQIIRERNQVISLSINNLFIKIKNYIELLSNDKRVINAESLGVDTRGDVLAIYRKLKEIDPDISYVYSGYENGALVINDYTPPPGYDPRVRPWYKAALQADPMVSTGTPYQEIKTHEWLVSFSKVLKDGQDRIKGVLSIDVSLSRIVSLLNIKNDNIECFITDKDGKIIIHKNPSFLNKTYQKSDLLQKDKITYLQKIDNLNWIVVVQVDRKKVFAPVIFQILIYNLIVFVFALAIGWGLSYSFTKKIVRPTMALKERVECITENKPFPDKEFRYPKNELGLIAEKIETLTQREVYKRNAQLMQIARRDGLTNLYNRRYMLEALNDEWERAKRYKTVYSVILFDIDHFKQINDVYGHLVGDEVLKDISKLVVGVVRETDKIGRWGGEEFLILCPETKKEDAWTVAEKLRKVIEGYHFSIDKNITISAGIAEYNNDDDIEDLIKRVDEKLYEAKNQGRNRIVA